MKALPSLGPTQRVPARPIIATNPFLATISRKRNFSDGDAYRRFFGPAQHTACDKGSGKTSIVEASNTRWRQRHSGLMRRSCGVYEGIIDDLTERFLILADKHNRWRAKRWEKLQLTKQT